MTAAERGKLLCAVLGALAGTLVAAALHVVAAHCTRHYAATLQPFSALRVYAVQVAGFVAAVLVGGAAAGLLGGAWGGLGGGVVGLASGTGIRECLFGWLVAVIPAWPAAPGPVTGFSVDANTALLVASTAHLSARTTVYAVAYAIVWIAAVTYAGWAGAFLARGAARRGSTDPACR
ncbi:MAG: hypothetical protein ACE5JM_14205 [Armatimonadota bacterium]